TSSSEAGAAGLVFVLADLGAAADFGDSIGLDVVGGGSVWAEDALVRSHPIREPMRKLTARAATMARVPTIRVQTSRVRGWEGGRRVGSELSAMASGGGNAGGGNAGGTVLIRTSGRTISGETAWAVGGRRLSSIAARRIRAHSSAKLSSSFWSESEKAAGEVEKASRSPLT